MIILDTNVVSEVLKPQPDESVLSWLYSLRAPVALTALTVAELRTGLLLLPQGRRRDSLTKAVDSALRGHSIFPFDKRAALEYAQVVSMRRQAGLPISTIDAQIAAVCRSRHAVCATRNTKDFQLTGIELVNPWKSHRPSEK
ncbi:type II toxin-antitoxin system VapC family toxin [Corynebacterium sp.]|uniref:type II toxin-antitoxin system VapC family toxin n=1 Tax=Corynebacterium sp. TaxID=1720 RepID=UPI0026DDB67C|nr:type II toxin-antitoxin system VapC family toxin [Corynebacterium sp.]MDO5031844.1 type II toxin-antitoxin system VapC family toxin [Corynebacterium sp.]